MTRESIHDWFSRVAAASEQAIAIDTGDRQVTYSALEAQSNRLANILIAAGTPRHAPVAILLDDVSARSVDVTTTDGDISFVGDLRPGGTYRLSTHDGDLSVVLPANVDATVTVSTFDGEFMPEIPITLDRFRGGKEMSFTLGSGGARLTLNAFDGDIVLRQR